MWLGLQRKQTAVLALSQIEQLGSEQGRLQYVALTNLYPVRQE
jgi:hypothetical protein